MSASLRAISITVLVVTVAVPACAQTVDYDAAEQMFGEPVTTSATGKPQRVSDAPTEMDIVTTDEIRRSGADNIPDVLRFVTGLDVRQYGEQDASVGIRGYNTALNPRVLVLLNGRQVYQDDYGMTVWPLIPVVMSEIRQIEIIKGPSAALYGFNAVSGVINIVTYDPMRNRISAATIEGGTQHQTYGEAVEAGRVLDWLGIRLSAKGIRSSEFSGNPAGGIVGYPQSGTVSIDGRIQIDPLVQLDLSGSVGRFDSSYYADSAGYVRYPEAGDSMRALLVADTVLGMMQLDAYRNESSLDLPLLTAVSANWQERVDVVQLSDVLKFASDHTLRITADYRDNSASSARSFSGRMSYMIAAASLMWDWQIMPDLSFTNAIRVDDLSLSHQGPQFYIPGQGGLFSDKRIVQPSFNSGVVLKVTDYDTIRLTAAHAIQLPSLMDLGFAQNFAVAIVAGNPGLQPSAVTNLETDYDRALPSLASTLRIAAFAQRTEATIGSVFGSGYSILPTGQPLLTARNFGDSSEIGGEIGVKGSTSSGLHWNASYALSFVHDDTDRALLLLAPSVSYQRQTPTHAVILAGGYARNRVEIDVQARWQSHFEDYSMDVSSLTPVAVDIRNYVTVDARIGYRIARGVTVALTAEQLNQQRIMETAGLQVDRRLLASIKVRF